MINSKKILKHFYILVLLSCCNIAYSQSSYLSLNNDYLHSVDRLDVLYKDTIAFHTNFKPYRKLRVVERLSKQTFTDTDSANAYYLKGNSWLYIEDTIKSNQSILRHFYRNPFALYSYTQKNFALSVNPILYLRGGKDFTNDVTTSINTRGLELEGLIDNKIAFYTYLTENQVFGPDYFYDRVYSHNAVPGANFWKDFYGNGFDFFQARGYVSFNATKHVAIQAGHDQNFIGNGYRSMILSDFAGSYPFVKMQTSIWRFQYTNLYAKLTADLDTTGQGITAGGEIYPRKWLAMHHLSFNITNNLNVGFFESIVSGAPDSTGRSGLDLDYVNPVIFYRSIEQNLGSEGNAITGLDFKWNLFNRISLYGQFVLDEFYLANIRARNGWWANKQSGQIGLKYFNVLGINNLDLQTEFNFARPFTYAHSSNYTSYTHYKQELAHPLGANFREFIGIVRYQPFSKLTLVGKAIYYNQGLDRVKDESNGGLVLKSYNDRIQEYGNTIGQGVATKVLYLSLRASYQVKPNAFIDVMFIKRNLNSDIDSRDNEVTWINAGLRLNISPRSYDY